jgi:hypothetical protein
MINEAFNPAVGLLPGVPAVREGRIPAQTL